MFVPAASNVERTDIESFGLNTDLEMTRQADRFWIRECGTGFCPTLILVWTVQAILSSLRLNFKPNLYDSVCTINPLEVVLNLLCICLLHMGTLRTKLLFVAPWYLFLSYDLVSNQLRASFLLARQMATLRRLPCGAWIIVAMLLSISAMRIQEWLIGTAQMIKLLKLKFYMRRNAARISSNPPNN